MNDHNYILCMVKGHLCKRNRKNNSKRWSNCSIRMEISINTKHTVATTHVGVASKVRSTIVVTSSSTISLSNMICAGLILLYAIGDMLYFKSRNNFVVSQASDD